MIISNSDFKVTTKSGHHYWKVMVICGICNKHYEMLRSNAKKKTSFKCRHCNNKLLFSGNKYGKGKTPSNFQIKCITPCEWCGKLHYKTKKQLQKRQHTWCGASCQVKWQHKYTDFNKGKNNPSYIHGERINGKLPNYGEGFTKLLKLEVKKRDKFQCQKCGLLCSGYNSKNLDVHHIDGDKFNNDFNNLKSLCKQCHTKTHWKDFNKGL
jgi:DNA-directed RNA polymerase subunit RPC12/RpoP